MDTFFKQALYKEKACGFFLNAKSANLLESLLECYKRDSCAAM